MPLNVTKLIGQGISGEPPYPQITLALTKLASIAIDLDISASIANSTHVRLVFAMPQNISKTVVHFAVVTTQLAPYFPHLHHPTIPLLPPDQSVRCLLADRLSSPPSRQISRGSRRTRTNTARIHAPSICPRYARPPTPGTDDDDVYDSDAWRNINGE